MSYYDALQAAEALLRFVPGPPNVPEHHSTRTPERFVNMLREMTEPTDYDERFTTFDNDGMDEMIVLGPIPFYTLCAHHIVPFFGQCWIGYVPREKIAGLSKFPRVVKGMSKGYWVQEGLTQAIANYLEEKLQPRGVVVRMRAEHLCMAMRGVQQPGVITTTTTVKGVFGDHARTAKAEFLSAIGHASI